MADYLDDSVKRYLRATGPDHDEIHAAMADHADECGFPIIGPDAGGVLRSYAAATRAERVFEFGSGFGYSAYWFLKGMADDGEIILTEIDKEELAEGERFLAEAGVADRATFEHGDAMEIAREHEGPFDVVLIDHQKSRYADAFELIRDELAPGGVVIADNIFYGAVDYEDILPYVESGEPLPDDDNTRGIADYLDTVRAADGFHTVVLPVGSGLAVTTREA
ncbi:O-methyltransferase [Halovivax gelatinilyticus]|uniref:O-methyltransferase n=1 Tax=Halovivax gelatinilyticus TaxID=2961597 RepID=UPI0020CA2CBB|nr:O-methyltransferase [Halovivax gelatinilyticus]